MNTAFSIQSQPIGTDAHVVALAGEVDLYTAPELKGRLVELIERGDRRLIVDFTEATFIDSTTLGVLLGAVKRLHPHDGQMALVVSDRAIVKVFEVTGLDKVFDLHPDRPGALRALGLVAAA